MKFKLQACSIWELGKRANQEDYLYPPHNAATTDDRLFLVCDGIGGHSAGEVASTTVCEVMARSIHQSCPDPEAAFTDEDFKKALTEACDALDAKDNGDAKKMGTTLTLLKFHAQGAVIAHIGDSRVYHIRPGEGKDDTRILFQTADHSLVNDLIKFGEMTPEEALHSKQRHIITRAIQCGLERRSKADLCKTSDIEAGDYFMLCSDGIIEEFLDSNIQYIFSERGGNITEKAELIKKLTANNSDNHTAWIVQVTDVIHDTEANETAEDAKKREDKNTDTPAEHNGFFSFINKLFK